MSEDLVSIRVQEPDAGELRRRRDILAPSSATRAERGDDTYPTPPAAVHALLTVEQFPDPIWEPAAGPGGIVQVLRETGHQVVATTITDQGCADCRGGVDFLEQREAPPGVTAILTNPPFSLAADFVRHGLTLVPRVAMLLRLAFLESIDRTDIIEGGQLARIYAFRNRLPMMHRDGWTGPKAGNAHAYGWFVWEVDHNGPPTLAARITCEKKRKGVVTLGSHQQHTGKSHVHLTPKWIIDRLGPFDLDPCAVTPPRPWDCARENFVEADDGLTQPWPPCARVWMNPPFDRAKVESWIRRLAEHGTGTALLHARTETDWFAQVWLHASGFLCMSERIKFCKPDGTEHPHNSGAPPVLVAFGEKDLDALRKSGIAGFLTTQWEQV
jgi:hypothetical protein